MSWGAMSWAVSLLLSSPLESRSTFPFGRAEAKQFPGTNFKLSLKAEALLLPQLPARAPLLAEQQAGNPSQQSLWDQALISYVLHCVSAVRSPRLSDLTFTVCEMGTQQRLKPRTPYSSPRRFPPPPFYLFLIPLGKVGMS